MSSISQLSEKKISPENFRDLYAELHKIATSNINLQKIENDVKTLIESIIEYLIDGDKNDPTIFDIFCELNFMSKFVLLVNSKNRVINLQIIKSFSLLISNLRNTQSLFYLFSNNFINEIISADFDKSDGDFLYYYVNFIKSLVLKIDETTIQFFYHQEMCTFPLLENCLKLYNNPDTMINNVIRNTFLSILKIKYDPLIEYICGMPSLQYFAFIACRTRDLIKTLNKKMIPKQNLNINKVIVTVNAIIEALICDILFFQDIYSLNIKKINFILTNVLFHYIVLPVLCASLLPPAPPVANDKDKEIEKEREKNKISPNVSFYVLTLLFKYIKNENFLNSLTLILFSKKIHFKLIEQCQNPPKNLSNYESDWNNAIKPKKYKFKDHVMLNFTENFAKALLSNLTSPFSDVSSLIRKIENKFKNQTGTLNANSPEVYKSILEELYHIFSNREMEVMHTYHSAISKATGIQTGLSYKDDHLCFMNLMHKTLILMKQGYTMETDEKKFITNELRSGILFKYLKSKDDSTIFLCTLMINEILRKEEISDEVKAYVKFLNTDKVAVNKKNGIEEASDSKIKALNIGTLLEQGDGEIKSDKKKKQKSEEEEKINFMTIYSLSLKEDFRFKEFFQADNEKVKEILQNNQNSYNYDFVGRFLNLVHTTTGLNGITYRLVIDTVKRLILYNENQSVLDIEKAHTNLIIKKIYYGNLTEIAKMIENNKSIQKKCLSLYEREHKQCAENIQTILTAMLSDPFELIKPSELVDANQSTIKDESKLFKDRLTTLLSIYDLFCVITKSQKINLEKIKEEGKSLLEEIKCKICIEKNSEFKDGSILLGEDDFFIITIEDISYKNKVNISNLEVEQNEQTNNIKLVYTDENGERKEIVLSFEENDEKISQVKKILEERSNFEFKTVKGYFDKLVSQYVGNSISK